MKSNHCPRVKAIANSGVNLRVVCDRRGAGSHRVVLDDLLYSSVVIVTS